MLLRLLNGCTQIRAANEREPGNPQERAADRVGWPMDSQRDAGKTHDRTGRGAAHDSERQPVAGRREEPYQRRHQRRSTNGVAAWEREVVYAEELFNGGCFGAIALHDKLHSETGQVRGKGEGDQDCR